MHARTPHLRHPISLLALACALAAARPASGSDAWPAFPVDWSSTESSPADVSFLLGPVDRRIVARDGRLAYADGRRFRIWGINVTGECGLPAPDHAPVIAGALARRGINCVRFHFLDRLGALIPRDRPDTRALDPDALARLDRFVWELKRRGIYSDLNLNVYRTYKPGDGVRDAELLGIGKGATYFDPRLIELQKEYARRLLTHVNPFTSRPYCDEPAVALVEFVNENSLVEAWFSGRLEGRQTTRPRDTWHDIPPSYAEDLTRRFNDWLARELPRETLERWRDPASGQVRRLARRDIAAADPDRFRAEARFYVEIEREFFDGMARFLRDDLGVAAILVGNSDHGHGNSCHPLVSSLARLDAVDSHVYWQHPRYLTDPATGRRAGFRIANSPMVDDPLRSSVVQLSRTAVAGKPFTVSEVNHPFPSEFACEGIPILAAYAALQDWDGIFWYTLDHRDVVARGDGAPGHFDLAPDPVKMSQLAAGALLFLRGDVAPARETLTRTYSPEQVLDSIRLPSKEQPYFTPGFPLAIPLIHGSRVASFDGPPTAEFEPVAPDPIRSDSGELAWHKGRVEIDTPLSQALVGRVARSRTTHLRADLRTAFCALTLSSLDGRPVADAGRLLLTLAARVASTGMRWNEGRNSLEEWGRAPIRIEPVQGAISLVGIAGARAIRAQTLDGAGRPAGKPLALTRDGDGWALPAERPATTWCVLTIER